jgi:LacI family transcriptional regulator
MKYTMEDIARMCGVSRGTVNRAVYNKPGIKEETRKLILDTIKKVGYYPDRAAQSLVSGRSHAIGMIMHNMTNEFNTMMYDYVQALCGERGYYLHFASSNSNPELEAQNIQRMIEYNVDGILIFPIDKRGELLNLAINKGISVVQMLNHLPQIRSHAVIADEQAAIRQLVNHMLNQGHTRITYVEAMFGDYLANVKDGTGAYNRYVYEERIKAYLETMAAAGHPVDRSEIPVFYESRHTQDGGVGFAKEVMASSPTAILCYDDFTAIWLLTGLKKLGVKVPEDVSLVGFDDVNTLNFISPALSTIRVDFREVARLAAEMLFADLEEKQQPQVIMVEGEFIDRDSIRRLKA